MMGDRKISQASDMLNWRSSSHADTRIDIKEETYASSQEDLKKMQGDSIMKRIPRGAEATTVLVSQGEPKELRKGLISVTFRN